MGTPTAARRSTSVGSRLRAWARRYLAAEVAGTLGAVIPAVAAAHAFGGRLIPVSVVATIGETVTFYVVFVAVQAARRPAGRRRVGALARRLVAEFGPAETIDIAVIRPMFMYLGPLLIGSVVPGVLAGKVCADLVFFGATALVYEVVARRRPPAPDTATHHCEDTLDTTTHRGTVAPDATTVTVDDFEGPGVVASAPGGDPAERVSDDETPASGDDAATAGTAGPADDGDPFGAAHLPDPATAPATPYLAIDLGRVTTEYMALISALPGVTLAYPLAANPAPDLLRHVGTLGVRFVARSLADVRALGRMGVRAADVRLDVSVLPWWHVRDLRAAGLWRFRADSAVEIAKIARYAPGAAVVVPVALDGGPGGVSADRAYELLVAAREAGLRPWGLACRATAADAWEMPVAACAVVMNRLRLIGVTLSSLDLDEGVTRDTAPMVMSALRRHLPYPLAVAVSVGRALVAPAGTITATVIGLAWRAGERWVHLDVGARNGGAAVAVDGSTAPLALADERGGPAARYRVTGPVGDGPDALGEATLSADLVAGDLVRMRAAGAYTTSAAAPVAGYPVPVTVCTLRTIDRAPADAWADWADWAEWEPAGVARGGLAGLAATLAGARLTTDATTGGWRRRPDAAESPRTGDALTADRSPDSESPRPGGDPPVPAPRAGEGPAGDGRPDRRAGGPERHGTANPVPDTGGRSRALRRSRQPATVTIPNPDPVFDPDPDRVSSPSSPG